MADLNTTTRPTDSELDAYFAALPAPAHRVRIAQTPQENTFALIRGALHGCYQGFDTITDDDMVALMTEPEFYADCTPLEKELIIRLCARLEWERTAD